MAQGQLANDLVLEMPDLPVAIDLYDPWLIENFAYPETLGLDPYRNDHATWVLQMSRGDFFLCSSEEQRTFYLGFLAAARPGQPRADRGGPRPRDADRARPLRRAGRAAGAPAGAAAPRGRASAGSSSAASTTGTTPGPCSTPWPLLDRPWTLLLIRNPNPESTPQRLFAAVEARCRALGWWGSRVQVHDWVPAERRYDLLRDVDLLVAPHRPSLETRLSLRTRFLDALAAGCPVVTSEGGAMSRLLAEHRAGWMAPPGDAPALARALAEALDDPGRPPGRRPRARRRLPLGPRAGAARPLLPRALAGRDQGPLRPRARATVAPPDRLAFRLRRKLRVWRRRQGPA